MPHFFKTDILLPDFSQIDGPLWPVIACDQFTGEPEYWEAVAALVKEAPSTLNLILPEIYLAERDQRLPAIRQHMKEYRAGLLQLHRDAMIYIERTDSSGHVRRGLVGAIDLEEYDYSRQSHSLIRATEGTVTDRIPPRLAVRRQASLELPHVMLLMDDPEDRVIGPLTAGKDTFTRLYGLPLMLGGGRVCGYLLPPETADAVSARADALMPRDAAPLLFAVGDGNHSLATAREHYLLLKEELGEAALNHPARYALVELVNLHDDSLAFEPIYRIVYGVDPSHLIGELTARAATCAYDPACRCYPRQRIDFLAGQRSGSVSFVHGTHSLPVGTLQTFLDSYCACHPDAVVDYIHGEDTLRRLAARTDAVGFLFQGMGKYDLFPAVMRDGPLPRKTFSMGHARDKRYYLEARCIRP